MFISMSPARCRCSIAVLLLLLSMPVCARGDQSIQFDIPAQPLVPALKAFAAQSRMQLLYRQDAVAGTTANAVVGSFEKHAALERLLQGTGLDVVFTGSDAVTVKPRSTPRSTAGGAMTLSGPGTERPMRLANAAPVEQSSADTSIPQTPEAAPAPGNTVAQLDEVVVTGSHIRGAASAGTHVTVISKEEIERSGHARLEDVLETLPQNFSGSASEDSTNGVGYNPNRAAGIDLRGLGSGTTLVLVNGHRQPGGDLYGTLTDISSIPSSAVERVEILTDGASAIYGSDAIGGVVNFILRKDYEGAETRARVGSLDGNSDELQLAQLFGTRWSNGSALIGYQYYERDPLLAADIPYLATMGDNRKYGGTDLRQFHSNPGIILDSSGRPAYAIPAGQNGTGLSVRDLTPLNGVLPADFPLGSNLDRWFLPREKLHTIFLSATQRLSESLELFAEGRYANRAMTSTAGGEYSIVSVPATNAFYFNPTGARTPVRVAYNFGDDGFTYEEQGKVEVHSEALGIRARVNDWQVVLMGSYGKEQNSHRDGSWNTAALNAALASGNPGTALNVFGDAANSEAVIKSFAATDLNISTTTNWGAGVVADGPLVSLFGRDLRLALGADYRSESLDFFRDLRVEFPADTSADRAAAEQRRINAAFAELAIPLIPRDRPVPGARHLELSIAGRYEDYSDFGRTFNPKVGLTWQPLEALQLRGTWGSSFKAPKLIEIAPGYTNNLRTLAERVLNNPESPGTTWRVLVNQARNPDLHEETADVWTAGFDFTPAWISGLTVSMSYFDIDYSEKVDVVSLGSAMASKEGYAAYASYIVAHPSAAQLQELCGQFPGTCSGAPIGAIFNAGLANLSKVFVAGADFDISQSLDTGIGRFAFAVGGTRLTRYDQIVVSGTPELGILDTVGHPLALRLRGKLSWGFEEWSTGVFVNYSGSYDNPGGIPARMDSWTTVDMSVSYQVSSGMAWLNRTRLAFSVNNVADELPPFLNTEAGYDTANGGVLGRKLSLMLVKEW